MIEKMDESNVESIYYLIKGACGAPAADEEAVERKKNFKPEELKKMIKTGETITVEAIFLEEKHLQDIHSLPHVFDLHYENQILILRCTGAQHNLIRLLNYLQSQDITFGRVFSELPTLNDVFLEITGKQLRD